MEDNTRQIANIKKRNEGGVQNPSRNRGRMEETDVVGNIGNEVGSSSIYGDPQFINPLGLVGHLLVQFWTSYGKLDRGGIYNELTIDPNEYYIIGCDEDERRQLLRYRSHFDCCTIRSYHSSPNGVIGRAMRDSCPEMSPDISYYTEDEYPLRDFALSCGIRSSFCSPFVFSGKTYIHGIVEIVSTRNQDVGTLRKFCESFNGLNWSSIFQKNDFQKYAIPEIDHFLKEVCQTFHLPLTQYRRKDYRPYLVHQFSYRDFESLATWCQFKYANLHKSVNVSQGPLGYSNLPGGAFFCRDISALSITQYPFAHYARNCGSISCFTIYLRSIAPPPPREEWVLEFFLPAQQTDNDYPQTFFNSLWATIKEFLPNHMLASGEQLGQPFSVKVIRSKSSTYNEPISFEVGQPHSSLPHHGGLESPEIRRNAMVAERVNELEGEGNHVRINHEEDVNFESLSKHFGRLLDDAAKSFGVSRSTFKRICRGHGIKRWRSGKRRMWDNTLFELGEGLNDGKSNRRNFSCSGMAPVHETNVAYTSQDLIKMTVKATYAGVMIRFQLTDLSGIAELEENVIERLHLEKNSFSIKYEDDEGDWVLIGCDKDVRECIEISRSLKRTTIKMSIDLPINPIAL